MDEPDDENGLNDSEERNVVEIEQAFDQGEERDDDPIGNPLSLVLVDVLVLEGLECFEQRVHDSNKDREQAEECSVEGAQHDVTNIYIFKIFQQRV